MNDMLNPGYYDEETLREAGFASIGKNVRIARNCTIIGIENISIDDNVRIDGYSTITAERGGLRIGSYVHVGGYCVMIASEGIVLGDFVGISQGVHFYTRSDDYSGRYLTNPMVPAKFTGVTRGRIELKSHVLVGSGAVIMPGVIIGEGASVGALTFVNRVLEPWGVYGGCPARRLKDRCKRILDLEKRLREEDKSGRG